MGAARAAEPASEAAPAPETAPGAAPEAGADTTKGTATVGLEEIVVTAEKRSERLQDVPVSVTALSADQLESMRVNTPDALVTMVPNLQLASTVGGGTPIFALRGVTMSDYSLNQEGPIATYYDEVYKGNFALLGVNMYDIERVEVLRGPQGTLYGKNTTGGAINIISRKPDFSTDGYLSVGYGNYNRREVEGAVQAPITETIAARLAFTYTDVDGWLKNLTPGKADLEETREKAARLSLMFKPSEHFDLLIRGSVSYQDPHNYGILALTQPGVGVGGTVYQQYGLPTYTRAGLKDDQIQSDYTPRRTARTNSVSATANWYMNDELTLTSISSWDKGTLFVPEDTDGAPNQTTRLVYYGQTVQYAEDIRLTSDFSGPFNFIVGAYYNQSQVYNWTDNQYDMDVDVNGDGVINSKDCAAGLNSGISPAPACREIGSFNQMKETMAAYTDLRYALTDQLTLRGGVRFTHDNGNLDNYKSQAVGSDGVVVANLIPGSTTDLNATASREFQMSNLSGKFGIDYKTEDGHLIYLSYSRGYRGSSFNAQAFFNPQELSVAQPETLDSTELGIKTQFFDHRLQVNADVFWYQYHNMQFLNFNADTQATTLVNLPEARVIGGELEVTGRPIPELTVSAGLGLLKSEVQQGSLSGTNLVGNQLLNAPGITLNGVANWEAFSGDWGHVDLQVSGNYVAKQYFDIFNNADATQGDYGLLNARISYRTHNDRWGIAAWANNLVDQFYFTSKYTYSASQGYAYTQRGTPRMFGVTLDTKF